MYLYYSMEVAERIKEIETKLESTKDFAHSLLLHEELRILKQRSPQVSNNQGDSVGQNQIRESQDL